MGGKGQLFAEGVAQSWEHSVNREYGDGGSQTFNSNTHTVEKSQVILGAPCQLRVQ